MNRRDASIALLGVAAASPLMSQAQAQTCTAPCYPQSDAEKMVGVTPTNTKYPPGNLLRYGADNTGNTTNNNVTAMQTAMQLAAFVTPAGYAPPPAFIYAPAGIYIFNAEVTFTSSSQVSDNYVTLTGDSRATKFVLSGSAPSGSAILHWTANAGRIRIEKLTFDASRLATSSYCLNFAALQAVVIADCDFLGVTGTGNSGSCGISIAAAGGYATEDVNIRDCEFQSHYLGVAISGPTSSVRISDCAFSGNQQNLNSIGVDCGPQSSGITIQSSYFTGWGYGIYSQGGYLRQVANHFESNNPQGGDWVWVNGGSGNAIYNCSIGDINPGSVATKNPPKWSYPPNMACYVVGPTYY